MWLSLNKIQTLAVDRKVASRGNNEKTGGWGGKDAQRETEILGVDATNSSTEYRISVHRYDPICRGFASLYNQTKGVTSYKGLSTDPFLCLRGENLRRVQKMP